MRVHACVCVSKEILGQQRTRYDVKSYGDADNDVVTYAQA